MRNRVSAALSRVAQQYPADMVSDQLKDIPRIVFNIGLALPRGGWECFTTEQCRALEICDLGGGIGLFSVGCAALGFRKSILIDDFNDPINYRVGASILDIHRGHGVEVLSRDVPTEGIMDLDGSFDAITTFDSMEHWHRSPKVLFSQVVKKLKPGGVFVLGVPNCVNLRKRVTVPFGFGKWSAIEHWYEELNFRGHVREPDVEDLRYIARDMGLEDVHIWGRNWVGYYSPNPVIRAATHLVDYPLRLKPTLCGNIYMTGRKPG